MEKYRVKEAITTIEAYIEHIKNNYQTRVERKLLRTLEVALIAIRRLFVDEKVVYKCNNDIVYCPACGSELYHDTDYGLQKFNHCPWCGAKLTYQLVVEHDDYINDSDDDCEIDNTEEF